MNYILEGFAAAFKMIVSPDREMAAITLLSFYVSTAATLAATAIGLPAGLLVAVTDFPGRRWIIMFLNTMMFIPSVLVGLLVYAFISRQGPLGSLGILYTPAGMIAGQAILAFPVITALTLSAASGIDRRVAKTALSLGADNTQKFLLVFMEARFAMLAAIITGFAKVFSEVGVSMMLGGNIRGYTRNITTAISLETGKGEFALGIALGIIMLTAALLLNILFGYIQGKGR